MFLVKFRSNGTFQPSLVPYNRVDNSIAVSPAGRCFAALEYKGRISIYGGREDRRAVEKSFGIGGKQDVGNLVAFLSEDRLVGLRRGGNSPHVLLRCSPLAADVTEKRLPFFVSSIGVSPDGKRFALGCEDRFVRIYDSETLELARPPFRVHDQEVTSVEFHPTLPILATGSADMSVRLWDWEQATLVRQYLGLSSAARTLDFTPDGNLLGALATDLHVWDLQDVIESMSAK